MEYEVTKDFDQITLKDDFMFFSVMSDKELCKELLERILDIKIKKLVYVTGQDTKKDSYDGKGVRLDIYTEDSDNTVYNVEMQAGKSTNLPKRSRFYQSAIDLNQLQAGMDYDALKNTIVIFICTFDVFKKDFLKYTFKNICMEDKELALNDATTKVFVNTTATLDDENLNPKLVSLIEYINSETITDEYTKKLDEAVRIKRRSADWRVKYMKYELNLLESRREGIEEGKREGKIEGIIEGRQEGEEKLATLMNLLYREHRFEDIGRVASDKQYKEKLYKEFNIQ